MLRILIFALLVIQAEVGMAQGRSRINLDQDWKFSLGHANDPNKDFQYGIMPLFKKSGEAFGTAADPKFNDSLWRKLDLPHDWAVELPFEFSEDPMVMSHGYKPVGKAYPETSIGWYRKKLTLDESQLQGRVQLTFDGVFRDAEFWVNGFYLGNQFSGYMGVSWDVTDLVRAGENTIAVRVDASQYEGWFYEGAGIYRHVWLETFNPVHFVNDGIFLHAVNSPQKSNLTIDAEWLNESGKEYKGEFTCKVFDAQGKLMQASKPLSFFSNRNGVQKLSQTIQINNPILWDLERPYLYTVEVSLSEDGKITDKKSLKFGFRTIEVKKEGVFLNGKKIKIQGVNCHQDHGGLGSALPDYMQYYRIRLLKNMGVNAYRASHNPPTPELLDACDELGMLVLDETRLLNSGREYLNQFEQLLRRDRSRTSVFLWSIGNEEGWIHTNETGKKIAQTFIRKQQELDPYRTCTYAADLPNVYQGINEVIPVRGFNYREFAVEDYHRDHPNQPLLGTEMGSTVTTRGILEKDSLRAYLPDQDITFPWWASTAEKWWTLAAENDFWLGGFVWTGFDYRGEPTPFQWPNVNSHFGIMDMAGFPKNIYYYYQSWWTNKDILHISPHWNWQEKRGQTIDVYVNSNADRVELILNGKSQGEKTMPRNGHLKWELVYQPGKLEAVAYKGEKRLYKSIETTGVPTEVVLTPYKTTLMADGKDVSVINVTAFDEEGREVPNAANKIRFKLAGNAKIIGVSNGDPSSHEADKCADGLWERSLFGGKAQLLVQSGMTEDLIHIEAESPNLWSGSTDIMTVLPSEREKVSPTGKYELKGEAAKARKVDKMIGADISFLPQLEARGMKFKDVGIEKDAIEILKDHGFNYVRLRIFNDPGREGGYAPGQAFCDLSHTLTMAKRVKQAGLKLLLDFHYSDYWADPGKQYKPKAWEGQGFDSLQQSLYDYTYEVIKALKDQGTSPDMVQIGNEINHGIVWPEGSVSHPDQLAQLIKAGTAAVKAVDPTVIMMLHVALGGQHDESKWFIDEMVRRGVHFDVIGESYYPKWHGTLDDLRDNLNDLARLYQKDIIVVEYSAKKDEVHKIAFEVEGGFGKGTCIWEPLSTWERIFERDGNSNDLLNKYDIYKSLYLNDLFLTLLRC